LKFYGGDNPLRKFRNLLAFAKMVSPMKFCDYCGRESADKATCCSECGNIEFRDSKQCKQAQLLNQNQQRICIGALFAIFLAIFHELMHAKDSHAGFSADSVIAEIVIFGVLGFVGYMLAKRSR